KTQLQITRSAALPIQEFLAKAKVALGNGVRVLGADRAVSGAEVDLGRVGAAGTRIEVGQRAHIHVEGAGLELVATVEVDFNAAVLARGQKLGPVDGGVPVAQVKTVVERIVNAALQGRL